MKCFVFFVLSIGFVSCIDSNKKQDENLSKTLNGWWSDSASSNFSNCYANFQQVGDSVYMTHFIEFNGQPFFETGKGIIKGDSLIYTVIVRHRIEGWSTQGVHKLKLIGENILNGTYLDNKGNKGPLVFRKR